MVRQQKTAANPPSTRRQAPVVEAGSPQGELIRSFEENLDLWANHLFEGRYDEEADTERLVWRSLETLLRVSGSDGCSIALVDWNQELLLARDREGVARRSHLRDTMLSAGCLGHDAMRSGKPQTVQSTLHDPLHHYSAAVHENRFGSVACFPLGARGKVLGVLSLYFRAARTVTPGERNLGSALAQSIALAIDNSFLLTEARRNYLSTVQALVRTLEARDQDTSYHSLRVTQYAALLGEQIGLSPREARALQFGAMLHDIGKIGIISEILNKKSQLTREEYAIVRRHPLIGARIVETVDFLQDAIPIIRHHHEAFDGNGYPGGLAGKEIPLAARIVAVPDFFDALTTQRPYRPALPPEAGLEEIRTRIGANFDPEIARLFISIHENGGVP